MDNVRSNLRVMRGILLHVLPRLGVVAYGPIQYHTPLWQLLANRENVIPDVLFLSDRGYHPLTDPGFGTSVAWDIDLLSGYGHSFLTRTGYPVARARRIKTLAQWLPSHDAVVVNGYTHPWMLLAMAICRARGIPYFLRGSSHPQGQSTGMRRYLRRAGARMVVSASAGGLSMGRLNDEFYRQQHARRVIFAPNSVDNERFAVRPQIGRSDLLARWGLKDNSPVIMFCGKLIPRKRPADLIEALRILPHECVVLFVGDGMLADRVRAAIKPGQGAVTGFINQAELPSYYHAADILVLPSEVEAWGLVINEGMAAGALPVVSDRVGAGPDLVEGLGEVYPCGDIAGLATALSRALRRLEDPGIRDTVQRHAARYSLDRTAAGFEEAVLQLSTPS
jgi:glycosyltransferase involved in cell wall biosynthesis